MPCNICGHMLVDHQNKIICPKCSNLKFLRGDAAIQVAQKRINHIRQMWKTELGRIHRDSLLLHLITHREVEARKFLYQPGLLDVDQLFSDTLFIKRVLKEGNPSGTLMIDNVEKSGPIIALFNATKGVEIDYSLIKAEYALIIYQDDFDLSVLSDKDALNKFSIIATEDYEKLMKSYELYGLMPREKALEKQKENASEFERIMGERQKPISMTREQFIEKNFDFIRMLYVVLLRNYIYSEIFELRPYQEFIRDPSRLNGFVSQFNYDPRAFTRMDIDEFISEARKFFKKSRETIEKHLLCDENNSDIFPLFVKVNVDGKSFIPLSQIFTYILYVLLHAVTTYDLFINEVQKRGKIFEDEVKNKFVSMGYSYRERVNIDLGKSNSEIDGIAVKGNTCIVVECKHHGLPVIVESSEAKRFMVEDLKGIVDGKKRIPKDGKHITIDVASLPQKVDYVKQNLSNLGIKDVSTNNVHGLAITYVYPLLSSYKGLHFLWLNDVSNERIKEISH